MLDVGTVTITTIPLPGNSQHVLLADSTRRLIESRAAAASAQAPGSYRNAWKGKRITGSVKPTDQGVTLILELLTDHDGTTASAFEADTASMGGSSSISVAAGATQLINWLPMTPDWRIRIVAGATAPTTLDATAVITPARTSGAL